MPPIIIPMVDIHASTIIIYCKGTLYIDTSKVIKLMVITFIKSFENDLQPDICLNQIQNDIYLSRRSKKYLLKHANTDEVSHELNITFKRMLFSIWGFTQKHSSAREIKEKLNKEIVDSFHRPLTAKILHLLNAIAPYNPNIFCLIMCKDNVDDLIISLKKQLSNEFELINVRRHLILIEMLKKCKKSIIMI